MEITRVRRVGLYWETTSSYWRPCSPGDERAERVATVDDLGRPVLRDELGWRLAGGLIPLDPREVARFLDGGE